MSISITLSSKNIERFWRKVNRKSPADCWEWKAAKSNGYGQIKVQGMQTSAHIISWIIHFGNIPNGLNVCHECDNPPCVNPSHLFLGTDLENYKDRDVKGRTARGEKHGNAKLKESDVLEIRRLLESKTTLKAIADKFKIGVSSVRDIKIRRVWFWLK